MTEFTKERIIEELKSSTQNASGMFEISDDTICALMSMLTNAAPQLPRPAVPDGLNPQTTDLVLRFSSALAEKLYKAERKYGRSTDWMRKDWYNDCLQSLWEHIEKGDPMDVAAYCAFMWHHGWVTTDYDRNVHNACRATMLHGAEPVTDNTNKQFESLSRR